MANAALEEVEEIRLSTLEVWGVYEAAYFANERGVLGDNEWTRFERMICIEKAGQLTQPFWRAEYRDLLPVTTTLTPDFVDFAEDLCG